MLNAHPFFHTRFYYYNCRPLKNLHFRKSILVKNVIFNIEIVPSSKNILKSIITPVRTEFNVPNVETVLPRCRH